MNPIEHCLQTIARGLRVPQEVRDRILEELRQHIEETRQDYLAQGRSEAEAERLAVRRLGDPRDLCRHFNLVHKTSLATYLLDLFHLEKQQMYRTALSTIDWITVLLVTLVAYANAILCEVFVLPKIEWLLRMSDAERPLLVQVSGDVAGVIFDYWWILGLLGVAAAAFVWWSPRLRPIRGPLLKFGANLLCVLTILWSTLCLWALVMGFAAFLPPFMQAYKDAHPVPAPTTAPLP